VVPIGKGKRIDASIIRNIFRCKLWELTFFYSHVNVVPSPTKQKWISYV
jgi:hypothetical protein